MAEHGSIVRRGPVLPIDVAQLVMDALYDTSSPEDHCYRNQQAYRSWSLVCHAWRMYAQSLLFRIVELNDPASLRRFSAHLDSAPRLAHYVRSLRIYSRALFTQDNVFSVLPEEIKDKLPNLRILAVTLISGLDSWHPLSPAALSQPELAYVPLPDDFHTRLAPLSHVTTLKLYFVSVRCFCVLARILHAFHNLRELAIIEVHWSYRDPLALMPKSATAEERDSFLPKIEDLTLSWLDPPGPQHILAAIGSSGARTLKHLYIDSPVVPAVVDADQLANGLVDLDLSHCTSLRDLWVSIPYPLPKMLGVDPRVAERFASVLASWAPASVSAAEGEGGGGGGGRTLTITPTFESDFTRAEFVEVLRAFGPVAEAALLDRASSLQLQDEETDVRVCVIERDEKRAWWADTVVRECFPRMYARGRVRVEFWKRYWEDSVWLEDNPMPAVMAQDQPANAAIVHPTPAAGGPAPLDVLAAADVDVGRSRGRSFKKMPGLVLARITKVARALVRRNV